MLRLDVRSSRELQAVLLAIRGADRAIQANIRRFTKESISKEFIPLMREHTMTRLENRVLVDNARAVVSNQNITLSAGKVGRRLAGGLLPRESAHAIEFGGDRKARTTYTATSRKGKKFTVTRHTRAQLRPRKRNGYVFFPAVESFIPRAFALWTQTTVRTMLEAFEGKTGG
jgi:hypothetical protein